MIKSKLDREAQQAFDAEADAAIRESNTNIPPKYLRATKL